MRNLKVGIILCIFVLFLGGISVYSIITADTEGPAIIFGEEEIVYREKEDERNLLEGIAANDERDGDVTDSLMIESIITLSGETKVKIIYVAKDHKNNITKVSKIVPYIKEESDIEEVNIAEEAPIEELPEETSVESADEVSEEIPVLTLIQNEVTLKTGDTFNTLNYVKDITDDKDEKSDIWRRMRIEGDPVNTQEAGDYTLAYYVVDSDGNFSEKVTLLVHVVE